VTKNLKAKKNKSMFPDLKIKIEPIPRPKFKELLKKKFLD
jgi:hypothetical protein